jgi:holo-[acyl-carrier protein] synthase
VIVGLGADIVDIERVRAGIDRHGDRFVARFARASERRSAPVSPLRKAEYWAARIAAKEAFAKAVGTGIGGSLAWRDVGIGRGPRGKPELDLGARARACASRLGGARFHVTLSHTGSMALAVVVLESGR